MRGAFADRNFPLIPALSVPAGTAPWVVVSGLSWGSLAGGADGDLWYWDGERAEFVGNLYGATF